MAIVLPCAATLAQRSAELSFPAGAIINVEYD
jgi:hypothetical protein